jgi:hypothetical protein
MCLEKERGEDAGHRTKCVIDNEWDAIFMANVRNRLNIRDGELRVSYRLDVHGSGVLVDRRRDVGGDMSFDEFAVDVELLEVYAELAISR